MDKDKDKDNDKDEDEVNLESAEFKRQVLVEDEWIGAQVEIVV
jgi:hypothetical protein